MDRRATETRRRASAASGWTARDAAGGSCAREWAALASCGRSSSALENSSQRARGADDANATYASSSERADAPRRARLAAGSLCDESRARGSKLLAWPRRKPLWLRQTTRLCGPGRTRVDTQTSSAWAERCCYSGPAARSRDQACVAASCVLPSSVYATGPDPEPSSPQWTGLPVFRIRASTSSYVTEDRALSSTSTSTRCVLRSVVVFRPAQRQR